MLEEMAQDADLKATQRLRAIEELGRIESRRAGGAAADDTPADELAPDPMADLDDMERQRMKRAERRAS